MRYPMRSSACGETAARVERRHALLQASATIEPFAATAEEAVRRARNLLAEIERNEKTDSHGDWEGR